MTSVTKFLKFVLSHIVTAKFSNPHKTAQHCVADFTKATIEREQWAVEDSDSDTREDSEAAGDS